MIREFAEDICDVIHWCRQKADGSLERWLVGSRGVGSAGDKYLCSAERFRDLLALRGVKSLFEAGEVLLFFLFDVLREVVHEVFDGRHKLGVVGPHVLELFQ